MTTSPPPPSSSPGPGLPLPAAAWQAAGRLARVADLTPVSPAWWGTRLVRPFARARTALVDRERSGSSADRVPGPADEVRTGLGFLDELMERVELGYRLMPAGRVERATVAMQRLSWQRAWRVANRAAQLASRGWCDEDVWSLDAPLCARLGAQLAAIAQFEAGDDLAGLDPEAWPAQAHRAAQALLAYAAAGVVDREERTAVRADAQSALHWVADNLDRLWT